MTEQLTDEQAAPVAAPVGPTRVSWGTVPKVNLLPLEIIQGRRFARVKLMLGGLVVCGVVVAGAGTFLAQQQVSKANDDLSTAQGEVSRLQIESAKYSAVPQVTKQVEAASSSRASVMSQDILWYQFMNDLDGALPSGVTQQTVAIALIPATSGTATTGANPLAAAGIGTLTITGTAAQYDEVSAWLENLAQITGVSTPALTSATRGTDPADTTVTYTVAAVLNDNALSHRYDQEGN